MAKRKFNSNNNNKKKVEHRINRYIRVDEVRLVGDNLENSGDVVSTREALSLAETLELDLVEITPNANPPIAKILDYSKFLYEERKRKKDHEKKQKVNNKPMKEIRLTPNIGVNDLDTKKKKLEQFLVESHKVKLVIRYKGREMYVANAKEKGEVLLLNIADEMLEKCKVEALPKLQGKQMFLILAPLK